MLTNRRMPVDEVIDELKQALRSHGNAVLAAQPGAGKTTRVPLALLDEPWLAGRRIYMLEPRRLAARSAARYMAASLGEKEGQTVGYRVRSDTKVSSQTRIEVITEGVLTRMLQQDPALEQAGLIIFDEFHERSLQADLGLALCLQSKSLLREDLRLLVMSATLETEPAAALLQDAPVIVSEGRTFPVETRYVPIRPNERVEQAAARCVLEVLKKEQGDVLVFLPGAAEIRRTEGLLVQMPELTDVRIAQLYGTLPQEEQDAAIQPSADGKRKVVLTTSIAETSLTVEGITAVIDSGLSRVSRYSPRTGMTRLETVPVSRASADQRRGRAGRLATGVCYRLWAEADERLLPARTAPELLSGDLTPLVLELAVWGETEPSALAWLDPPPAASVNQARALLRELGAVDERGGVTPHGRRMAALGAHPRLAHMLLRAVPLGLGALACAVASLLGERDILRAGAQPPDADLRLRLEALRAYAAGTLQPAAQEAALRRIDREAARWARELGLGKAGSLLDALDAEQAGLLLAFAFPDRVAKSKGGGRYLLSGGRGAYLPREQPLAASPYLVCAELDDSGAESRIWLAAPISEAALYDALAERIVQEDRTEWDSSAGRVRAVRTERLGAITLKERPLQEPESESVRQALLQGLASEGLQRLTWTRASQQLRDRLAFMHHAKGAPWPDMSDAALLASLQDWLGPYVDGIKSLSELQRIPLHEALISGLAWEQQRELEAEAPAFLQVPSGSRIAIDYSDSNAPFVAVRLQEVFGLSESPRIGGGRIPLTFHLLSPAQRPVQVTRDLAGFWRDTYFDVRKDLKGRYPKHYWPDHPLEAEALRGTKPKGR